MKEFELVDISTLSPRRILWVRLCNFLGLLNVAANRWICGLPIRVFNLKK